MANRLSILRPAILALLLATTDCKNEDAASVKPDEHVQIANTTRQDIALNISDLFTPSAINSSIPRTEIPDNLGKLLGGNGKLSISPIEYDPSKPNIYLIANRHFSTDSTEKPESIYAIQERIVRIFHILHSVGVKKQFLEGVAANFELEHDKVYQGMESPSTALPLYKKSHRINRATRAIEGIYGAEVESRGVEMDIAALMDVKQKFDSIDKNIFPRARTEIMYALAQRLGIPIDADQMNDRNYLYGEITPAIRLKLNNKPQAFIDALVNDIVLANSDYRQVLQAAAHFHYVRTKGRNKYYAENINQLSRDGTDAVFIVGSNHIPHLRKLLTSYNVFVISPTDINHDPSDSRFAGLVSEKDYSDNFLASDLFRFGVQQNKPTLEVGDE